MLYYSNVTYVRRHMSKTEGRDTDEDREAFAKLTVRPYIEGFGVRSYCYCYCYWGLRVRWSDHTYCGY